MVETNGNGEKTWLRRHLLTLLLMLLLGALATNSTLRDGYQNEKIQSFETSQSAMKQKIAFHDSLFIVWEQRVKQQDTLMSLLTRVLKAQEDK